MRKSGYFLVAACLVWFSAWPVQADELVRRVQRHLSELGYYKGAVDGDAGSMTGAAVRRYQIAENLKVTGELNKQTLERMGLDAPAPAPEYKAIQALFGGGPLARADAARQVQVLRAVQVQLAELGYYAGAHNGLPGSAMTAAIKEWQAAQGLRASGLLDAETLARLGAAESAP
jgi:peptidoglycan hydrolase-like protein with peptidoglycan-binding domain